MAGALLAAGVLSAAHGPCVLAPCIAYDIGLKLLLLLASWGDQVGVVVRAFR